MLGDYIEVRLRGDQLPERITASKIGGSVEWDKPGRNDLFIEVRELNRTGATIRTALFGKTDVLYVIEGHR